MEETTEDGVSAEAMQISVGTAVIFGGDGGDCGGDGGDCGGDGGGCDGFAGRRHGVALIQNWSVFDIASE